MTYILIGLVSLLGAILFLAGYDYGYRRGSDDTSYNFNKILKLGEK